MNFFLRRWQSGDEQSLVENANNYKIWKNLKDVFPHPYTITDAYEWVNIASGSAESFAIEVENKAVGGIGILLKDDIYRKNAEIGYWLGEPYWGNKIISTAIVDVVNYTFANYDIYRIYAGVFEYNIPSMRVLEKAGFEKEAILKESLTKEGKLYDEHIYAKYRE
ncbi:GNAT family N-acetyltransferase [Emticicia agri]|uniref:N-acetyltransferase n=1 Tax=Emticicia agri TaxID=2492393 RepID=A0A4Q5LXZ6_9BACT|nr:GNAT family protein [Emticicia agri]RYU94721.1 N-acetyltransferase [Emticicia agri]